MMKFKIIKMKERIVKYIKRTIGWILALNFIPLILVVLSNFLAYKLTFFEMFIQGWFLQLICLIIIIFIYGFIRLIMWFFDIK